MIECGSTCVGDDKVVAPEIYLKHFRSDELINYISFLITVRYETWCGGIFASEWAQGLALCKLV